MSNSEEGEISKKITADTMMCETEKKTKWPKRKVQRKWVKSGRKTG